MKPLSSRISARSIVQIAVVLIFLLPVAWMVMAALQPPGTALPTKLQDLPMAVSGSNFGRVFKVVPFGRYTLNSLLVVVLAVPLTLLISSWAGFAMARLPRPSQRRWLILSLAVLMVPGVALWSTRFIIYRQLGWLDSIWALIAPALMGTSPFFILMFYRAFRRIPAAIYDSARIDGAGVLRTWSSVALPVARPTAVAVAILSFVLYWGDFISPLLYLSSEQRYTLPIALQLLQQLNRSDWPLLLAAAVLTMAIPVLLFMLAQPYFSRVGNEPGK